MKKTMNAWSVNAKEDFDEMFAHLSDCGFEAVELNVDSSDGASAHSLTMETTVSELREILEKAKHFGLEISSVSTSLYGGLLGSNDENEREKGKAVLRKQMICAAALEADSILVVPGADIANGASVSQAYENAFSALSDMKKEIEYSKIYVCLENVWNGFFTSPFDMAGFIDRLNSPYIRAYYDVGNTVAFSDTVSWISVLGNRIQRIHIKDFKRNGGLNSGGSFVDLLAGNIDWTAVSTALRSIGYDKYLTAEVFPTKEYDDILTFYKEVSAQEDIILKGDISK